MCSIICGLTLAVLLPDFDTENYCSYDLCGMNTER